MNKFRPSNNGTGLLLTLASSSVFGIVPGDGGAVLFSNPNRFKVCVVWGDSLPLTATSACYPIFLGTKESLEIAPVKGTFYVAALAVGGIAGLLHVHRGYEDKE